MRELFVSIPGIEPGKWVSSVPSYLFYILLVACDLRHVSWARVFYLWTRWTFNHHISFGDCQRHFTYKCVTTYTYFFYRRSSSNWTLFNWVIPEGFEPTSLKPTITTCLCRLSITCNALTNWAKESNGQDGWIRAYTNILAKPHGAHSFNCFISAVVDIIPVRQSVYVYDYIQSWTKPIAIGTKFIQRVSPKALFMLHHWWPLLDSNQGPTDYESVALTNWAKGPRKCYNVPF